MKKTLESTVSVAFDKEQQESICKFLDIYYNELNYPIVTRGVKSLEFKTRNLEILDTTSDCIYEVVAFIECDIEENNVIEDLLVTSSIERAVIFALLRYIGDLELRKKIIARGGEIIEA